MQTDKQQPAPVHTLIPARRNEHARVRQFFTARTAVTLLATAGSGVAAIVLPVLIHRPAQWKTGEAFVPAIRNGLENLSWPALALLFFFSALAGGTSRLPGWVIGLATVSAFPVLTVLEVLRWPTSHNLWPFEFVMYLFLAIPGVVGAYAANLMRHRFLKSPVLAD